MSLEQVVVGVVNLAISLTEAYSQTNYFSKNSAFLVTPVMNNITSMIMNAT